MHIVRRRVTGFPPGTAVGSPLSVRELLLWVPNNDTMLRSALFACALIATAFAAPLVVSPLLPPPAPPPRPSRACLARGKWRERGRGSAEAPAGPVVLWRAGAVGMHAAHPRRSRRTGGAGKAAELPAAARSRRGQDDECVGGAEGRQ